MAPKAQFPGQLTLPSAVGRKKHRRRDEGSLEAETVVRKEILPSLQATLANLPHLRFQDPYGVIEQLNFKDPGSVSQWYFTSELDSRSSGRQPTSSNEGY
ncbi:hypothetical protein AC578_5492 [Pseudocercospora eumusae]|uniref:Uncharacterized protein n=1 Tax=Pseudocercospora eumusae TaxID=321146 RepID=A0A139H1H6_9PEZI|nr:hypothetical protein AC578_5492 [Pseudocercospora eumusae]